MRPLRGLNLQIGFRIGPARGVELKTGSPPPPRITPKPGARPGQEVWSGRISAGPGGLVLVATAVFFHEVWSGRISAA